MICKSDRREVRVEKRAVGQSPLIPLRYHVQFRDEETGAWREYAHFKYPGEAEACLNHLLLQGIEARMHVQQPTIRIDSSGFLSV